MTSYGALAKMNFTDDIWEKLPNDTANGVAYYPSFKGSTYVPSVKYTAKLELNRSGDEAPVYGDDIEFTTKALILFRNDYYGDDVSVEDTTGTFNAEVGGKTIIVVANRFEDTAEAAGDVTYRLIYKGSDYFPDDYSEDFIVTVGDWFYSTVEDLEESTALTARQQRRCIDTLIKSGLIQYKVQGMPAKRYFCINDNTELLAGILSNGSKSSCDKSAQLDGAVKQSESVTNGITEPSSTSDGSAPVMTKAHNLFYPNVTTCSNEKEEQDFTKPPNCSIYKTKEIKPKLINPINQSEDICKRSDYSQIIRDNTECDFLIQQNPEKKETILELIDIIVDTVCSAKPTIRVNGEDIPHDIVKSVFLKLNSSHIEYVLDAMDNNISDVRNIRSYLITALYNSRLTLNSYWKSRVNHDMNKR